jgi:hypothetical protein
LVVQTYQTTQQITSSPKQASKQHKGQRCSSAQKL